MITANHNCFIGKIEGPVTQEAVKAYCLKNRIVAKAGGCVPVYPRPFGIYPARWNAMIKHLIRGNKTLKV